MVGATTDASTRNGAVRGLDAPVAARWPSTRIVHGRTLVDEWAWLRDDSRRDPTILRHLRAENRHTNRVLKSSGRQARLRRRFVARTPYATEIDICHVGGRWWYLRPGAGGDRICVADQEPAGSWHFDDDAPATPAGERCVVDLTEVTSRQPDVALVGFEPSPDGRHLAYLLSVGGSERFQLQVVRTNRPGAGPVLTVDGVGGDIAWLGTGRLLYLGLDERERASTVWARNLGAGRATGRAELVWEEPDPARYLGLGAVPGGPHLQIVTATHTANEVRLLDPTRPQQAPQLVRALQEGVTYWVGTQRAGRGWRLVTWTVDRNGRVLIHQAPLRQPRQRRLLRRLPAGTVLEDGQPVGRHLVRVQRRHGQQQVLVTGPDGLDRPLPLPEDPSITVELDGPGPTRGELRLWAVSTTRPRTLLSAQLRTGEVRHLRAQPYQGHDPDRYRTTMTCAVASDGTRIPITITAPARTGGDRGELGGGAADAGGTRGLVLTAYGSYGRSEQLEMSPLIVELLEQGVAVAVAHVRGGGEGGPGWHQAATGVHKVRSFTDYLTCARALIDQGWVAPGRIVAQGGSAGGTLVGYAVNEAPELFAAAVALVPFVDCINTNLDPTLPQVIAERDEWGNPDDPDDFAAMATWSPYENVRPQPYPPLYVTGALQDHRVGVWEPAKWVQRLRAASTSGHPILLQVSFTSGHEGPSDPSEVYDEQARIAAFILDALDGTLTARH